MEKPEKVLTSMAGRKEETMEGKNVLVIFESRSGGGIGKEARVAISMNPDEKVRQFMLSRFGAIPDGRFF